jgi:hypothetical protein
MAQSKKLFYTTLIFITIYEKVQISKSKPKKFSILCTFNLQCVLIESAMVFPESVMVVPRYNVFLKLQGLFLERDSASFIPKSTILLFLLLAAILLWRIILLKIPNSKDYTVKKS